MGDHFILPDGRRVIYAGVRAQVGWGVKSPWLDGNTLQPIDITEKPTPEMRVPPDRNVVLM